MRQQTQQDQAAPLQRALLQLRAAQQLLQAVPLLSGLVVDLSRQLHDLQTVAALVIEVLPPGHPAHTALKEALGEPIDWEDRGVPR